MVARALTALILVAVVGCGTTDLIGRPDASHDPIIEDLASVDVPSEDTTEIEPACEDRDGDGHRDEDCGGDDCDDFDPDVYPGAPEVCLDGVDQDCDGIADGPVVSEPSYWVSNSENPQFTLTWTGSAHALLWTTQRYRIIDDAHLALLVDTETPIVEPTYVGTDIAARNISLHWEDDGFGLIYSSGDRENDVKHLSISPEGVPLSEATTIRTGSSIKDMETVWTGSSYGLLWFEQAEPEDRLLFTHVGETGDVLAEPTVLAEGRDIYSPPYGQLTITWARSRFLFTWTGRDTATYQSKIFLAGMDPVAGTTPSLLGTIDFHPSEAQQAVAWSGSEFGILWIDGSWAATEGVHFSRVSGSGSYETLLEDGTVPARDPSLAWTDEGYIMTWSRNEPGTPNTIYFQATDALGGYTGDYAEIPFLSGMLIPHVTDWTGSEMGVMWIDSTSTTFHDVWFTTVTFCE